MLRLAWLILAAVPAILSGPVVNASNKTSTPATAISCTGRNNGFYVVGCNQNFTECHEGKAYDKWCPSHLFFSYKLARCELKADIPECRNPKAVEGKILASPPEFNCVNRTDGFYSHPAIPCDKTYYVCVKGFPMRAACPYQQFFDVASNRCDYKARVPACKGIKISGVLNAPYPPAAQPGQDAPLSGGVAPPAPPPDNTGAMEVPAFITKTDGPPDCKVDGVFADSKTQCVKFFWKCSNQRLFKYECPNVLFYDTEAMRCDHKEFVPNCGGIRQVTTPPPAFDDTPVDFDCTGKEDGTYQKETCSAIFYTCLSGTAMRQKCHDGLVYDLRVKYCDYPLACNSGRTTTLPPPPAELNNIIQADAPTQPPLNFDCSSKKDGYYSQGRCLSQYIVCAHGKPGLLPCPGNLVFDGQHCNFLEACLNPAPLTTAAPLPSAPISQDQPVNPYQQQPSQQTVPPALTTRSPLPPAPLPAQSQPQAPTGQVNCAKLSNGATAVALCSPKYVECWEGTASYATCANGLIFNPYNKQCDYPTSIADCNGGVAQSPVQAATTIAPASIASGTIAPATIAPATIAPAPPGISPEVLTEDKKCLNLPNGLYGEGCSPYYYHCSYSKSYKIPCPAGLFYNVEKNQCDLKTNVRVCGGGLTMTPTSTNTIGNDQPTYGVAQDIEVGNQCTETSVKNSGCHAFYFRCQYGKIERVMCAPNLYYNIDKHVCTLRDVIPACGGSSPSNDQPLLPVTPTLTPVPEQAGDDTFCVGKETGYYGIGCNTFGYACVAGGTFKFNCPAGTHFNDQNKNCEWKETILACGGTPMTTAAPVILPAIQGAAADVPATPIVNFCAQFADGYYADGCNNYYYYCRSGQAQKLFCPPNTFFVAQKRDCLRREDVPACNGRLPSNIPPAQPALPPTTTSAPIRLPPQQSPPSFDCSSKNDGLYADPTTSCSSNFIQCYNGAVIQNQCQTGLFFNLPNGMCDYQENVPACGGSLRATTTPMPIVAQSPATARPYPAIPQALDTPLDASCAGKADGYYENGCSNRYYSCHANTLVAHKCHHNLRFDAKNARCDYPDAVVACGGSPAANDMPQTTQTPVLPLGSILPEPRPLPSFSCAGKADGYYENGCSDLYYSCHSNTAVAHKCHGNLRFDAKNARCDYPDAVVACGGSPAANDMPQTTQAPVLPLGSIISQAKPLPPFNCAGKADGLYPIFDCGHHYAQCTNGLSAVRLCQEGLKFNKELGMCDYPMAIIACGGKPIIAAPQPTIPLLPQPAATLPPQPAATLPPQPAATLPPLALPARDQGTSFCALKADGFYHTSECSINYVQCSNNKDHIGTCPTGLYYNKAGMCDYSFNVPGCPDFVQPTTPSTTALPAQPLPQNPLPSQPIIPQQDQPRLPAEALPQPSYQALAQTQAFSCAGKEDGIYGLKCAKTIWKCSGGKMFTQTCSKDTVFDGVTGGCDFRARVQGC